MIDKKNTPITYQDAGVSIERGDEFVEKIKNKVKKTYGTRVVSGVGGFACLYEISEEKLLAAGTDGVGTKLLLAQHLNKHETIGIDLVAMCVNDILCANAQPLFFMDYMATGKLDLKIAESIVEGIVEGCTQANMALIGGETAEMPGMYQQNEYDLAGFAVGEVLKKNLQDWNKFDDDTTLIGVASSGVHSNGFSLVRKLISFEEEDLLNEALTPTRIYVSLIQKLKENLPKAIKGLAHITGGGLYNIPRQNSSFDYYIEKMPTLNEIPRIFSVLKNRSNLGIQELYSTFNMGVGLVIATNNPKEVLEFLSKNNELAWEIGHVKKGQGKLLINF